MESCPMTADVSHFLTEREYPVAILLAFLTYQKTSSLNGSLYSFFMCR